MKHYQTEGANNAKQSNNGSNFLLEHDSNSPLVSLEQTDNLSCASTSYAEATQSTLAKQYGILQASDFAGEFLKESASFRICHQLTQSCRAEFNRSFELPPLWWKYTDSFNSPCHTQSTPFTWVLYKWVGRMSLKMCVFTMSSYIPDL